jgi:non-canonical purine NTP pyrophosphatase (RdgB/HAM1 family)
LDEVISDKAIAAYEKIKKPVLVEDVSFEIKALNGLPGPFVKYFLETIGTEGIVEMVGHHKSDTTAIAAIAIYNGKILKIFKGRVTGTLSGKNRGEHGFGFDKVFIPNGYNKTFAQLEPSLKNKISHRAQALKKVKKYLSGN